VGFTFLAVSAAGNLTGFDAAGIVAAAFRLLAAFVVAAVGSAGAARPIS
jgi:hypothetical protein